jgi:hypothetical protein
MTPDEQAQDAVVTAVGVLALQIDHETLTALPPRDIVEIVQGPDCVEGSRNAGYLTGCLTQREWEIIRWALVKARGTL